MTVARTRLGVFGPGQFNNILAKTKIAFFGLRPVLQLGEVAEDLLISRPDE